jgi:hypothetical protein
MATEILSLADILTTEEMRALMDADFSPGAIIKKFLEHPQVAAMEYKAEEGKFHITFTDGEVAKMRIIFSSNEEGT